MGSAKGRMGPAGCACWQQREHPCCESQPAKADAGHLNASGAHRTPGRAWVIHSLEPPSGAAELDGSSRDIARSRSARACEPSPSPSRSAATALNAWPKRSAWRPFASRCCPSVANWLRVSRLHCSRSPTRSSRRSAGSLSAVGRQYTSGARPSGYPSSGNLPPQLSLSNAGVRLSGALPTFLDHSVLLTQRVGSSTFSYRNCMWAFLPPGSPSG